MVWFGGENHGAGFGDGDHLLEVRAGLAIARADQPSILALKHFSGSHIDHRLDSQYHANLQLQAKMPMSIVWDVRLFMHASANAMANILTNYAEAGILGNRLHSMADIAQMVTRDGAIDRVGKVGVSAANWSGFEGKRPSP